MTIRSDDLKAACQTGNFEPLQKLAAHVNIYDEKGGFLLLRFVEINPFTERHVATLFRMITELKADVKLTHGPTGHSAASFGNEAAVKILLENGVHVDVQKPSYL